LASATAPPRTEPAWLTARRARGEALSASLSLPTQRTPGWEFTDLGGLDFEAFAPAPAGNPDTIATTTPLLEAPEGAVRLDQVDATALTTIGEASLDEPIVMSLAEAVSRFPELIERHFGSIVDADDPFVARNEASWSGGAFIYVPRGKCLADPVAITVVQEASVASIGWRTLIVLEEDAEAEVWEQYLSAGEEVEGVFNTVVELSVGQNARLRYVCAQSLSEKSAIFGSQRAEVGPDGSLDWVALGFGSGRGKVRMETKLAGRGAGARVTGAYASHARQHVDFDTTQEHAAPHTTSDLAFRGILGDRSTAVWRGMIKVDPGAQRTDAFQECRNLLLSKRAHADAIPGLEILANDVRCTHAAAIAQVDSEQLYYLMARGLSRPEAEHLIIEGFMQALVERFAEGALRDAVAGALERRLESILGGL